MKRFTLLIVVIWPIAAHAQSLDLSGEWRIMANDNPANALPSTDDSSWRTVRLPLGGQRFPAGTWIRRTVELPEDATVLETGTPGACLASGECSFKLYVNGRSVERERSPVGSSSISRWPLPERERKVTVALRFGSPFPFSGPNQPVYDDGPWFGGTREDAVFIAKNAVLRRQSRLRPYTLLAGVQLAQALMMFVIWFVTQRRYAALLWTSAYLIYAANNMLSLSLFPGLPRPPQLTPSVLLTCLALSLSGRDSRKLILCVIAVWGLFLATPLSGANINPWVNLIASAIVLQGAFRGTRAERIGSVTLALYIQLPTWSTFAGVPLVLNTGAQFWPVLSLINFALAVVVILLFMNRFASDRRERERLGNEFEAARTVQQLLLTGSTEGVDAVYRPAQEVGGDFYWTRTTDTGELVVVTGDVSGKGLKAAMLVSLVVGALRNERSDSPAEILRSLNAALVNQTGGGFVTCIVARIGFGNSIVLANAGNPAPYVDGIEALLEGGLPLGILAETVYEETVLTGDAITFISDGVVEACNVKGELFGFDRMMAISRKPAAEIAEAARVWGQNDDITVLTVRRAKLRVALV